LVITPEPPPFQPTADPNVLRWDADSKTHQLQPGETTVQFTFWLTNISSREVLITRTSTSCGCTVAQLPSVPWPIPPGGNGPIQVSMNLVGKSGLITKGVTVDTSVGVKYLVVKTDIPSGVRPGATPATVVASGAMNDGERLQNMQMALADRQVVFKNKDCAKCHADPAQGKTDGRLIYVAVCATCHNSHLRAAMVPDLRALKHPTDADHWRKWITYGRAGSMMPAFAASEGGPLNEQQVNALIDFMVRAFASRAVPAQAAPAPASPSQPTAQLPSALQNAQLNSGAHP
jgi:mono/diheme cytochrome c family protein